MRAQRSLLLLMFFGLFGLFANAAFAQPNPSAVGIYTRTSNSTYRLCSGVVIHARLVLTAAHCMPRNAQEASTMLVTSLDSLEFVANAPSLDFVHDLLESSDEASTVRAVWSYISPTAFAEARENRWTIIARDFGLIELKQELRGVTPARLACLKLAPGVAVPATHVGYSTLDRRATALKLFASQTYDYLFAHSSIAQGDSGGPVWVTQQREPRVVGIASTHAPYGDTEFAKITPQIAQWISSSSGQRVECVR